MHPRGCSVSKLNSAPVFPHTALRTKPARCSSLTSRSSSNHTASSAKLLWSGCSGWMRLMMPLLSNPRPSRASSFRIVDVVEVVGRHRAADRELSEEARETAARAARRREAGLVDQLRLLLDAPIGRFD